jgi:Putative motility protein
MTVSNSPTSLLDSVLTAQATQQEVGVAVLKKAQDTMKQQGEAMVQMLEQAGAPAANTGKPLLDTYA